MLEPIYRARLHQRLFNLSIAIDTARLNGFASPSSGDWLNAIPSGPFELRLRASSLRLLLRSVLEHQCVCHMNVYMYKYAALRSHFKGS